MKSLYYTPKLPQNKLFQRRAKGVARGCPGVPVTPLYKPFCNQTTYNIQVTIW